MDIITDADLASYLGDDITERMSFVRQLANDLVSELLPASFTGRPARLVAITLEVAARAVRNPGGYSSETVDDYTYRRDADTRQAGIYLTASERAEVLGLAGGKASSVRSIRLTSVLDPK